MEPTQHKTAGAMVGERRGHPRFHVLMRVDVSVAGRSDTYWGSVCNLSRTGVAIILRQYLKANHKVTIRFLFRSEDGREVTETLTARVIWKCGDNVGLGFDPPLTAGSPALQKAPHLVAHLAEVEQLAEKKSRAGPCKDTGAIGGAPSQC